MTRHIEDKVREERITMEIIVDAYGPEEQAMGWYYYLEDHIQFPFRAKCVSKRASSPLRPNELIDVISMAPEEECEREMYVTVRWKNESLAVPLVQLKPNRDTDAKTRQAVEDWHYWMEMGYQLG